jgi:guanylate kinase
MPTTTNTNNKTQGNIFVISAPSGAGKSSLVNALLKQDPSIQLSISHTTRKIRPDEVNDVNYFFISKTEFEQMILAQEFLEYANVYGNYYGTSVKKIQEFLKNGQDIILEIDYQGAMQIKKIFPNAILIFIAPPNLTELEHRLRKRNTDDEDTIQKRIACASDDMSHQHEFDYIIINNNFNTALDEMCSIILLNRGKCTK